MYDLRPIVQINEEIKFPLCMYRMRNIHAEVENEIASKCPPHPQDFGSFSLAEQLIKAGDKNEMAELEKRQKKLLDQLEELKKILFTIKTNLKLPNVSNTGIYQFKSNIGNRKKKMDDVTDVVINANPSYPPYFLLFLQHLLMKEVFLDVKFSLHSSVSQLPSNCEAFIKSFKSQENGVPSVLIRLIWKEIGPVAELSTPHYPVQGEANILRYLVRILDSNLNFEKTTNMTKIDSLLDLSYRLSCANFKMKNNLMKIINKDFKTKWLADEKEISIADVALYDALKKFVSCNEINGNLGKWFVQCEKLLEINKE